MSNVALWETSAADNDAAPPNGAPEGMAANTVNDTMREIMAAAARWYQDTNGSLTTGGVGNAYTLTTNNNNSALTDLPLVVFVANRANSGAATLNVDGLGAKSLRFNGAALVSGAIAADTAYIAIYNADEDVFDIVGVPTLSAATLSTGTLADARLSSNVPKKDASNTFTAAQVITPASSVSLVLGNTGAPENEKQIGFGVDTSTGLFSIFTRSDAGAFGETFLSMSRTGTNVDSISVTADSITLNGVNITDFARKSQANEFESAQTATNWIANQTSGGGLSWKEDEDTFIFSQAADTIGFVTGNTTALTLASGAATFGGSVKAATIANSTSETLVPGQIHHVDGNCTVPTLAAGQWVAIVNHSASPITLTRRSGTALYWTATGADSATVTIPARGRVVVSCAAAGSDYVGGDITGNTT